MRIKFLGDALDHWKGSVLGRLSKAGLLHELRVIPMITDDQPWDESSIHAYSKLLNVGIADIINRSRFTASDRGNYFDFVPKTVDLFLDPDTGITTSRPNSEHLTVQDIQKLLIQDTPFERVLAIYQHSGRGVFHYRLEKIPDFVRSFIPDVHSCVYQCGQVAMIFLSHDKQRIRNIQYFLAELLGSQARERVWGKE